MTIENLTELAEFIRKLPPSELDTDVVCGTACCIGGWLLVENAQLPLSLDPPHMFYKAFKQIAPHLTEKQVYNLCYPDAMVNRHNIYESWNATPEQAAQAIENLRDLGEPRWAEVMS